VFEDFDRARLSQSPYDRHFRGCEILHPANNEQLESKTRTTH
jgi:hypothetical protein